MNHPWLTISAGIAHENVDVAERFNDSSYSTLDCFLPCDVHRNAERLVA